MQIVPLEETHLFDLNAAILGWLLAAVQPKKQHPRHNVLERTNTPGEGGDMRQQETNHPRQTGEPGGGRKSVQSDAGVWERHQIKRNGATVYVAKCQAVGECDVRQKERPLEPAAIKVQLHRPLSPARYPLAARPGQERPARQRRGAMRKNAVTRTSINQKTPARKLVHDVYQLPRGDGVQTPPGY